VRACIVVAALIGTAAPVATTGCVGGVPHCCGWTNPARYDAGITTGSTLGTRSTHLAVGVSWASATPNRRTPLDVLVGYVLDVRGAASQAGKAGEAAAIGPTVLGGYLEVDGRFAGVGHQRGFAGLRFEVVTTDPEGPRASYWTYGLVARESWEIAKVGRGPTWTGALGVGVFVEAGTHWFADDVVENSVVAGLSLRVPIKFFSAH
jgi:hypothetical protein